MKKRKPIILNKDNIDYIAPLLNLIYEVDKRKEVKNIAKNRFEEDD